MKFAAALSLAIVLAGCSNSSSPTEPVSQSVDRTVALAYGQSVTLSSPSMTISFTDIADSRCPASVVCPWEGDAAVRLESDGAAVVLHTSKTVGSATAKLRSVNVTLVDIKPAPLTPGGISKSAYVATIHVTQ